MIDTWPGFMKPSIWLFLSDIIACIASGIVLCAQIMSRPFFTAYAVIGVVVSKPMARKTRSLCCSLSFNASVVDSTMNMSAPFALAFSRDITVPGTFSISPYVAIGIPFIASLTALSIVFCGVTQTGHPGPLTRVMFSGRTDLMLYFAIVCVCVPQTSMIFTGLLMVFEIDAISFMILPVTALTFINKIVLTNLLI